MGRDRPPTASTSRWAQAAPARQRPAKKPRALSLEAVRLHEWAAARPPRTCVSRPAKRDACRACSFVHARSTAMSACGSYGPGQACPGVDWPYHLVVASGRWDSRVSADSCHPADGVASPWTRGCDAACPSWADHQVRLLARALWVRAAKEARLAWVVSAAVARSATERLRGAQTAAVPESLGPMWESDAPQGRRDDASGLQERPGRAHRWLARAARVPARLPALLQQRLSRQALVAGTLRWGQPRHTLTAEALRWGPPCHALAAQTLQ